MGRRQQRMNRARLHLSPPSFWLLYTCSIPDVVLSRNHAYVRSTMLLAVVLLRWRQNLFTAFTFARLLLDGHVFLPGVVHNKASGGGWFLGIVLIALVVPVRSSPFSIQATPPTRLSPNDQPLNGTSSDG